MLDILVIAPHPDDAELGMAGAIMKFLAEGRRVGVLDLTSGEPTPHGSLETRRRETAAATEILGLEWRENLGLPNRSLEPTLEARTLLAAVIRREKPRWRVAPHWIDAHPDHVAATELVEAARFWAKLTKTAGGVNQGRYATALPQWQGKLGVEWDVPAVQGLTLTGNALSMSKQYINADNSLSVPGRTVFDLGVRYAVRVADRPVTLRAGVQNVANKAYWAGALTSGTGAPRTFVASASIDF